MPRSRDRDEDVDATSQRGLTEMARAALWAEYDETNDGDLLDGVVELDEEVLKLCPAGHPGRAEACTHLSTSLSMRLGLAVNVSSSIIHDDSGSHGEHLCTTAMARDALWAEYQDTGDIDTLEQIVELDEQILDLCPMGSPDRAQACAALAASLQIRLRPSNSNSSSDVSDHDFVLQTLAYAGRIANLRIEADAQSPQGHVDRAGLCDSLAIALYERYEYTSDIKLLNGAVELKRKALALRPPGHPNYAVSYASLAVYLGRCYNQTGDVSLLIEAIEIFRRALALHPPGHPNRAISGANLAFSLRSRYNQTGDVNLLSEALELERETLALHPPGHPDRAISCVNLAESLKTCYDMTGDLSLLDEATKLEREALALHPPGHPDRARSCASLAISFKIRYSQTGDAGSLAEATELERETLSLRPHGHPDRNASCSNLALSLMSRYHKTGDISLLNEATELESEALALRPLGHPDRSKSCVNLAILLRARYNQTGDVSLLNEVIKLDREGLALHPAGHPDRDASCANLAVSLRTRYNQIGDSSLLSEVIQLDREALALRPPGHPDHGISCTNLAVSLKTCYIQTNDASLLNEATELDQEALALCLPANPDRATLCVNFAASLMQSYYETNNVSLLNKAIELEREALELRPSDHPDRPTSCIHLAGSLKACYDRTSDVHSLKEAIELSLEASHSFPTSQIWRSLALLCLLYLSQATSSDRALSPALDCLHSLSRAEADDIGQFMSSIVQILEQFWSFHAAWTPDIPSSLVSVYVNVVNKLPIMAAFVLDTPSRLLALRSFSQLGSQACVVAINARHLPQAVELLDHAHGVIWAQALHQRDPQLAEAPKELALELEALLRAIAETATSNSTDHHLTSQDVRHVQNSRIQTLLGEIRALPNLDRFMRGSTYEGLRQVARDHHVIVLVAVDAEVFALIIADSSQDKPDIMKLGVTSEQIIQLRGRTRQAGARQRACTEDGLENTWSEQVEGPNGSDRLVLRPGDQTHSFGGVLSNIWRIIVKPILTHVGLRRMPEGHRRPRLHWCPTGHFASLPLHAAGIYSGSDQECSADYVVASYTPTLSSLLRAQRDRRQVPVRGTNLMIISASHASSGYFQALPNVKTEVDLVANIALSAGAHPRMLSQAGATNKEMAGALESASIVHIACHGTQNAADPLKSAFHLSDDRRLTVSDLMELDLKHAHLAFLSACETAKGDRNQPDQAIHLAATMLFVGFKSVIGTMWAMNDLDGPAIAESFYWKLFESELINTEEIPRALDEAVKKLREKGVPPERWATFMHVGA